VERSIDETQLREIVFALDKIKKHTEGKEVKKTIVVPNKLVNIVCI
jgi:leucyl-tRNA synthetase